jgi:hypothetical protein
VTRAANAEPEQRGTIGADEIGAQPVYNLALFTGEYRLGHERSHCRTHRFRDLAGTVDILNHLYEYPRRDITPPQLTDEFPESYSMVTRLDQTLWRLRDLFADLLLGQLNEHPQTIRIPQDVNPKKRLDNTIHTHLIR